MRSSATGGDGSRHGDFVSGEWTVMPSRNLLARAGQEVHVEPRVMDVLVRLAERAGQVVSKEELTERVWPGRSVTDEVLTVTIYALRKALGDDARRPCYVETVPRRGYRWIAPVASPLPTPPPVPMLPAAHPPPRARWPAVAATTALALFAVGAVWKVTVARHTRHVPPAEAHEAYLKGRYFLDQRSIQGWRQALEQFERAVALDSQDPAALAGLADTYSAMSDFGVASPAELRPRAMSSARRALELDARSAEAQEALGRAQFLFDWDFAAAERSLARAVELDEDYMPAFQAMAWLKSARGQYAEAVAAARRALQLDPVNTARYTELAWVLGLAGRHGEALHEIERALQLNPRSFPAYMMKGWAWETAGQPDAAFAAYREGLRWGGVSEESLRKLEEVYRAEGLAGCYRGWLRRGGMPMSDTFRAQMYVRVGDLERAIASLEHAYQRGEGALAWVNVEPSFRALRSDPRFQRIAVRVGRRN
jgi:DNA-binding winged helix-turn-helix (wHTH) protein/tetratricopeptide (TPR) repeat protein